MSETASHQVLRINFDVPKERVSTLDNLQETTGLSTRKELFNNALTMFKWAVQHVQDGRKIVALDTVSGNYIELSMVPLDHAAEARSAESQTRSVELVHSRGR